MRIAFFTPVSPQRTGIADYSEREILPHLSKYCDIDVYVDSGVRPTNPDLTNNFDCFSYDQYKKKAHLYDLPLYQMGNNAYHAFIYDTLLKYPGITVLHDIFLHGFLWGQSLDKGDSKRYISEFEYCYGEPGVKIAQNAIQSGVYPEFKYPLIKRIVDRSTGVISHSEFGIKTVFSEQPDSICTVIPQPFTPVIETNSKDRFQKEHYLKIPQINGQYPIITSFGHIFPHKRYNVILDAFEKFLKYQPDAFLICIGQDNIGLSDKIHELGLEKQAIVTGYISNDDLAKILNISDFCVNLRYPTAGETSRSVLQIMSHGKPVIVSNVGWFSELPKDTCFMVNVDSHENEMLLECFKVLSENDSLRDTLGERSRDYIIKKHNPAFVAEKYYDFIKGILSGNELIVNEFSRDFIDLGLDETDNELMEYSIRKLNRV